MIYNLGLRLFRNEEDALDFSQDVYEKAFSRLDQFAGRAKFSTWLYSLALNEGLNRLRKKKTEWFFSSDDEIETMAISGIGSDPFQALSARDQNEVVAKALESLPEKYRLPLLLYYYEELSYANIAVKLSINEGTLKANIHRGKQILRKKLEDQEFI